MGEEEERVAKASHSSPTPHSLFPTPLHSFRLFRTLSSIFQPGRGGPDQRGARADDVNRDSSH